MPSALFMNPKVSYEYIQDSTKVHFKNPNLDDGVATFMIVISWIKWNGQIWKHFQFVPVVCKECMKR